MDAGGSSGFLQLTPSLLMGHQWLAPSWELPCPGTHLFLETVQYKYPTPGLKGDTLVIVSFLLSDKIPETNNLKRIKIYFGSWIQRLLATRGCFLFPGERRRREERRGALHGHSTNNVLPIIRSHLLPFPPPPSSTFNYEPLSGLFH